VLYNIQAEAIQTLETVSLLRLGKQSRNICIVNGHLSRYY